MYSIFEHNQSVQEQETLGDITSHNSVVIKNKMLINFTSKVKFLWKNITKQNPPKHLESLTGYLLILRILGAFVPHKRIQVDIYTYNDINKINYCLLSHM